MCELIYSLIEKDTYRKPINMVIVAILSLGRGRRVPANMRPSCSTQKVLD